MERFVASSKFIQYQLWQDCRNGCKFCSELNQKSIDKKWSLKFILSKLNDPEVLDYDEVGIIGGEIFDNQIDDPEVNKLFYELIDKLASMHFNKIYIATSLIYDINKHLVPLLDHLRELGIIEKCLLCTSYDIKYRFNIEGKKELWENNMIWLYHNYPDLRTHVETIVTQFFIDAVLNKEFSISEFINKFHTRVDYIDPSSGMYYNDKKDCETHVPGFFPKKSDFIKFIRYTGLETKEVDLSCFISYQIRANRIYHLDCGDFVCYKDRRAPGFKVICNDKSKKYEVGFIDSDDTMEDIVTKICRMWE